MSKNIVKQLKKFLTVALCATTVASCCALSTSGADSFISVNSWQEKIEERLWTEMQTKSDDDLIKVWIWQDEKPMADSVKTIMREEKGMDPAVYENSGRFNAEIAPTMIASAAKNADETTQERIAAVKQNYSATKLQVVAEEYKKANDLFVKENVDTNNRKVSFVSKYTSSITLEATKAEIIQYAKLDEVEKIYFDEEAEGVSAGDIALNAVNADSESGTKSQRYNYNTGYKGRGVKIGIIEYNGIYDPTNPQLCNLPANRLRVLDNTGERGTPLGCEVDEHATLVTTLIVGQAVTINGKTYEGVAPEASVILTPIINFGHTMIALENLIAEGCSVINMSCGFPHYGQYYSPIDLYMDTLYDRTAVTFVVAAGNFRDYDNSTEFDPESVNIISPAKALNVITVGNAETKRLVYDLTSESVFPAFAMRPYEMAFHSSYGEAEYLPNKPDISAPGVKIEGVIDSNTVGYYDGTSFAAPIVTGIVAQLLECNANITPLDVKSILIAGAEYSQIRTNRTDSSNIYVIDDYDVGMHLREVSGAGLVNAVNSINIAKSTNGNTAWYSVYEGDPVIDASIGTLLPGQKVRIAMTFRKTNTAQITSTNMLDDVNISLYNSTGGALVASSSSTVNNVEIIEYVAPANAGGSFYYRLTLNQAYSDSIPTYVTWFKWVPGDLNGNGAIDTSDYIVLRNHVNNGATLTPEQKHVADVNRDGVLSLVDVTLIKNYCLGYNVVLQ